jgi:ribonuclease D
MAPLHEKPFVTVDTEFLRESTYWPILCLIQVAADADNPILIDPMAKDLDLAPFFELMQAPNVIKVFHAGRQDLEIIWKLSGHIPAPIFDTQVAASVLGYGDNVGYDGLVRSVLKEHVDKTSRFTDWSRRPLTDHQLVYAAGDVTHLVSVYETLSRELEEKGRADWLTDDLSVLTSVETYDIKPDEAWKKLKMRLRKPQEIAAAMMLAKWRESEAQSRDLPRRKLLKDEALFELAAQRPQSVDELQNLRSFKKSRTSNEWAAGMVAAIKDSMELDKKLLPKPPKNPQKPEADSRVTDLLKVLLRKVSEDEGVAARIVASSDDIDEIARDNNADVAALKGWRRAVYGEKALALKNGQLALAIIDGKLTLVSTQKE